VYYNCKISGFGLPSAGLLFGLVPSAIFLNTILFLWKQPGVGDFDYLATICIHSSTFN